MKTIFLKLFFTLLILLCVSFLSCDNKPSNLGVNDNNNHPKTFSYSDPYGSGAYMLPAEGGVYYYVANSDLIVKGSVTSITDVKDYVFPGSSGNPGCAKIAKINIENVYYSIDKIMVKYGDIVNLVINVLGVAATSKCYISAKLKCYICSFGWFSYNCLAIIFYYH